MLLRFRFHEVLRDPFQAIGQIGGAAIQASGAESAASTQAAAADHAADLQSQAAANSLGFQQNVFNTGQANEKPFLEAGQSAVSQLSGLLAPGGGLSSTNQWNQTFQAPTAQDAENNPGYQFEVQQGDLGLQRAQAASGSLLSGGAAKELESYNQGLASTNYQQVYNNALQTYGTNYNVFQQNQNQQYNRLAGIAGTGQTAAAQLGTSGQAAANNVGSIYQNAATQEGNDYTGAANAAGAASIASGNAWSGALSGISNGNGMGSGGGAMGSMSDWFQNTFNPLPATTWVDAPSGGGGSILDSQGYGAASDATGGDASNMADLLFG